MRFPLQFRQVIVGILIVPVASFSFTKKIYPINSIRLSLGQHFEFGVSSPLTEEKATEAEKESLPTELSNLVVSTCYFDKSQCCKSFDGTCPIDGRNCNSDRNYFDHAYSSAKNRHYIVQPTVLPLAVQPQSEEKVVISFTEKFTPVSNSYIEDLLVGLSPASMGNSDLIKPEVYVTDQKSEPFGWLKKALLFIGSVFRNFLKSLEK